MVFAIPSQQARESGGLTRPVSVSMHPIPWYQGAHLRDGRMLHVMAKRPNRSRDLHAVTARFLVSVVDDDDSVRESLPDLLKELGFAAKAFASANEFLMSGEIAGTQCLLLDIAMPDMSGPDLQRELAQRGHEIPVVFITARADNGVRRQLMEQGAVECLFKPFNEQQLRAALDVAMRAWMSPIR